MRGSCHFIILAASRALLPYADRVQMTDLPGTVHFITDAPIAHVVRFADNHGLRAGLTNSCPWAHCSTPPGQQQTG